MDNYGVIHRTIVGYEIIQGNPMNFQIGHSYLKRSIKVSEITEDYIEGVHWISIYVTKTDDDSGVHFLWWRISSTIKIQYYLDI